MADQSIATTISSLLNVKTILTLVLATGGVAGIIPLIKNAPLQIWSHIKHKFVFSITIYKYDEIYQTFENWFFTNYSDKFNNVQISLKEGGYPEQEGTNKKVEPLSFSQKEGYFFIKYLDSYMYLKKSKIDRANANVNIPFLDFYTIESFDKKKLKQLMYDLHEQSAKKEQIFVFCNTNVGYWERQGVLESKNDNSIVLPLNTKESLFADLDEFIKSESWYLSKGIPYSRGYLFEGLPGNGKTSISLSLANKYKKNLYALDLNVLIDDSSLKRAFSNLPSNAILLLEDIDAGFVKREGSNDQITFSCLLNCLDGVFHKSGLVVIMTTNHKELLDPALIRAGRIDFEISINNPKVEEVNTYLSKFFDTDIELKEYNKNYSMATIQGLCIENKKDSTAVIELLEC